MLKINYMYMLMGLCPCLLTAYVELARVAPGSLKVAGLLAVIQGWWPDTPTLLGYLHRHLLHLPLVWQDLQAEQEVELIVEMVEKTQKRKFHHR